MNDACSADQSHIASEIKKKWAETKSPFHYRYRPGDDIATEVLPKRFLMDNVLHPFGFGLCRQYRTTRPLAYTNQQYIRHSTRHCNFNQHISRTEHQYQED